MIFPKKLKNKIKINFKKNYKNCLLDVNSVNKLITYKKIFIEKYKVNSNKISRDKKISVLDKPENLKNRILKIYQANNKKKFIKELFRYYQKFNVHLSLKKRYNKNFKKVTNQKTEVITYAYFGNLLSEINYLNKAQIFNTLLKINDLLIINSDMIKSTYSKDIVARCFEKELKILRDFIK